jgi:hypothetical protein
MVARWFCTLLAVLSATAVCSAEERAPLASTNAAADDADKTRPLCETGHPLVDSASLAACASLPAESAAAIIAAFARGIEVPLGAQPESESDAALPVCPTDLDRPRSPRVLVARLTAPVAGVHEGRWEGRLLVEQRCRPPDAAGDGIRILGKEYLYQWTGSAWKMYQHSWLRAGR